LPGNNLTGKEKETMKKRIRSHKNWILESVLFLLVFSLIGCEALEQAQQRRNERIKQKFAQETSTSSSRSGKASLTNQPAPSFTLQDLSGSQVSLADFKGKPVVLNFWTTW
jgi:cytochrome oxidase Cu insertion factor (SCO1/SenC/PrrC family)